jgi:uncharacterized protein (TIGR02246 family)
LISADDRLAILDLLARYCWLVDAGDGDGWAALWTEDGVFTGIPTPLQGRDQLRRVPSGRFRHMLSNVAIDAGPGDDAASAMAYSTILDAGSGKLTSMGSARYGLVRVDREWRIKSLAVEFSPLSRS